MRFSLFAGAALCAPVLAGALQAPAHAADQAIVVTGRHVTEREKEVRRRPGGADFVAAADYENKVAVSLRDALAFSPGVYAQPRYGQEVRLSIRGSGVSRGFHLRGLALHQDGIPINLADGSGDFEELDPTVMEHIEVYRGASALRFGGTTLGGGIDAITPNGRSARGVSLRLDGGSFDTLRGAVTYGYSDEIGDAWLALAGDGSDGDRDHADREALRFHGNVGLRLSGTVETRFHASAQRLRQELPGGLALADALERPRTGNSVGDYQRNVDSIRLQNRTRVALGSGTIEFGGFANFKALDHPIFQVVDQVSTDWGLFTRVDLVRGPFELTLGGAARFGRVAAQRYANVDGRPGARTFEADQRAETVDLYGEGRYRIGRLSLIAGGVFSHGRRAQEQRFPARTSGRFADDQFSPRFGLIWAPSADVELYGNYSRSHEMPGFMELAQVAGFVPLKTQRAWTWEIGARGRVGVARFDVSLYRSDVRGELLQFEIGPDIPAPTFNAERTRHQGIEAGIDLDLASWARLRQVYQYNGFRFRNDPHYGDNRLPVVAKHLYRAELRLGSERLHVAPVLEWVPEGAWADYANQLRVDGYAAIGVSAEAEWRDGLSLFLDARNLTGTDAIGDITATIAADPAARIFYPIERRAVYAGIRARF
ncbi:TonB-dependent receptor domain-containing protein [Sphingosinicella sp. CPCC 101087]|uniref:TonB-dependent receptor family protein n=1 Tax=Sphingosinicella sp. CPCC 101087 TaxID=2497754 RepID=UPI00101B67A0|nr:TonB-dependent receptor [Sphingosinicella sp. CPCC 101087]